MGKRILFGAIVVRLGYLQIVRHDELARLAERQYSKTIPLRPERGPIFDRNGYALAVSAAVESVYALPARIADRGATAAALAPHLGERPAEVEQRLASDRPFVWVKPKVPPAAGAAIRALRPQLVIANQEENRRRDVERLESAGIPVWVTYPRTVADAVALLRELAQLGGAAEGLARVVEPIEASVARAAAERPARGTPVFCPIWKDPWMAVGTILTLAAVSAAAGLIPARRASRIDPILPLRYE